VDFDAAAMMEIQLALYVFHEAVSVSIDYLLIYLPLDYIIDSSEIHGTFS
jgi:hypothetical protein